MVVGESERLHSTGEAGEPAPGDPVEGRRAPDYGPVGGKDTGNTESQRRLYETSTDSGAGYRRVANP